MRDVHSSDLNIFFNKREQKKYLPVLLSLAGPSFAKARSTSSLTCSAASIKIRNKICPWSNIIHAKVACIHFIYKAISLNYIWQHSNLHTAEQLIPESLWWMSKMGDLGHKAPT